MHPMLNIAIRAARAAGEHIVRKMDRLEFLKVEAKGKNDYVSEVDRRAEQIIIDTILKAYPGHGILAEESGQRGDGEFQWIIDPLDGTTNYLHGFPQFAVSIGIRREDTLEQGVIYDPLRQELFTATRGSGAQLNNRRIRVSRRTDLEGALVGTGFPHGDSASLETFIRTYRSLFHATAGIRRAGAAALDLAYVACGRLDGFWEFGLEQWDMAAGALMIQEAGGLVSGIDDRSSFMTTGNILAANPKLHAELKKLLDAAVAQS